MLRLWPEQITAGLFPGHCWIRRGGRVDAHDAGAQGDAGALAATLDKLLAQAAVRGSRLDIIASDKLARIVVLPWQDKLRTEIERTAYAVAAFTQAGIPLNEGWACTTAFKRYGELGLGIACPAPWLGELEAVAQRHGSRLRSVMPVSAAAYWAPRRKLGKGRAWVLVEEGDHAAVLRFDAGQCTGHDAQPGDAPGLNRLLRRQLLSAEAPGKVFAWRADGEARATAVSVVAPEAEVKLLDRHYWDLHA